MKNAKIFLAGCTAALLVGCGDYAGGDQVTAARDDSGEAPNFGSATDIVSTDGTEVPTNNVNYADHGVGGTALNEMGYRSQPRPGQDSDEELAKKIKVALTTGSMGTTGVIAENELTDIQVEVRNGVVTLSGPVATEEEKQTVQKQVEGMKGVDSVRNELTVGARSAERNPVDATVPRSPGNR